jgi:acid-sensing ion channel, other
MPNELTPYVFDIWEIGMQQSVNIVLKPRILTTSDALRDYPIESRNCYYSNERKLRFFNDYTQYNCQHDCAANVTLEHCGCVTLNYPGETAWF